MDQATEKILADKSQELTIAYNRVFTHPNPFTDAVLQDLAVFCRANESTFHPDPRMHAVLEGRREVWLRIMERLMLSSEEVYRYHVIRRTNQNRSPR